MPITKTPLRYPGGKSQLGGLVKELIAYDNSKISSYVEPYCGGAGIAMELLLSDVVEQIAINDADPGIFSFWTSLFHDPERLIERIWETSVDIKSWHSVRELRAECLAKMDRPGYSFDLGFSTFYLNRTSHSGIIGGGVLGGLKQSGSTKIDCRFNKPNLVKKIRELSQFNCRVDISCLDGVVFLEKELPKLSREKGWDLTQFFVYLDPPYVKQGKFLYMNNMETADHVRLRDFLKSRPEFSWFLTYDNETLVRELYQSFDARSFDVRYSANRKGLAAELAVLSEQFSGFDSNARRLSRIG